MVATPDRRRSKRVARVNSIKKYEPRSDCILGLKLVESVYSVDLDAGVNERVVQTPPDFADVISNSPLDFVQRG